MSSLEAAILISVITSFVMILVAYLMYTSHPEKRFWHVIEYWFGFLMFSSASVLAQANGSEKLIGLPLVFLVFNIRGVLHISNDICGKNLLRKWHIPLIVVGYVAGFMLAFLDTPFWAYTLAATSGFAIVSYAVIFDFWRSLDRKKTIPLYYLYFINVVLHVTHLLDFPFLRLSDSFAPIGFGIATALILMMAIILPGLTIHELQKERSRILEVILSERNLQLEKQFKMSSLGEMTATLVHELGNPLTFLGGRNSLMLRKAEGDQLNKPELILGLNQMQQSIQRMVTITKSLRTYSRDSDQDLIREVKLRELVDETLSFTSDRFFENNLSLIVGKIPEVSLTCKSVQISQVLVNLLNNAYDAIQTLPSQWVRLDFEQTSYCVKIMVIDSGKGIPQPIQDKMMQPFFTTKEIGKGTGLGLSISHQIVMEHKGKLFLDRHNLNTTFIIELPVV